MASDPDAIGVAATAQAVMMEEFPKTPSKSGASDVDPAGSNEDEIDGGFIAWTQVAAAFALYFNHLYVIVVTFALIRPS